MSEYTHSDERRGYKVDESSGVPARAQSIDVLAERVEQAASYDFKKKFKRGENDESFKEEYKTTWDAVMELRPWKWREQLRDIKAFTPEEYETILRCEQEMRTNVKLYSLGCSFLTLGFAFWQRRYVRRGFYAFSLALGVACGCVLAWNNTSWFIVQQLDALGKDYEISRLIKQDIFDTRPDVDAAMRA